jgi:hypothetical protein
MALARALTYYYWPLPTTISPSAPLLSRYTCLYKGVCIHDPRIFDSKFCTCEPAGQQNIKFHHDWISKVKFESSEWNLENCPRPALTARKHDDDTSQTPRADSILVFFLLCLSLVLDSNVHFESTLSCLIQIHNYCRENETLCPWNLAVTKHVTHSQNACNMP